MKKILDNILKKNVDNLKDKDEIMIINGKTRVGMSCASIKDMEDNVHIVYDEAGTLTKEQFESEDKIIKKLMKNKKIITGFFSPLREKGDNVKIIINEKKEENK